MKQLLAALLLLPALAFAAPTATLSWIPATTRADGTPLPSGTPFFNVYAGASGAETLLQSGVTGGSMTLTGVAGATLCAQVTQIDVSTGAESARSIEACKTFPASPPNAPTGVTLK